MGTTPVDEFALIFFASRFPGRSKVNRMIVIEFGGNTLRANTLPNPEKPANSNSANCNSLAEYAEPLATSHLEHRQNNRFFALLRTWIEQNILKPSGS
jgi:hypothetical protein